MRPAGLMRETIVLLSNTPTTFSVSSLTRSSATATAVTSAPHGYATNDYVTIAGADPTGYNGKVKTTVVDTTTFTFTVSASLTTPATGTITAVYASDAQGGRRIGWTTVEAVAAELVPQRATERLQAQAVQSQVDYRFRIRTRADLSPQMRVLWRPTWPANTSRKTLEVHGIVPVEDGRTYLLLECGEIAA